MGLRDRREEGREELQTFGVRGDAVRYQMRERMLSIGDDFWIEDDRGNRAFKVDGKALRARSTLHFVSRVDHRASTVPAPCIVGDVLGPTEVRDASTSVRRAHAAASALIDRDLADFPNIHSADGDVRINLIPIIEALEPVVGTDVGLSPRHHAAGSRVESCHRRTSAVGRGARRETSR